MAKTIPVNDIMNSIKDIFNNVVDWIFKAILFPFKLWFGLPWWVHTIFLIVIFIIVFLLWNFFLKNKNEFEVYV